MLISVCSYTPTSFIENIHPPPPQVPLLVARYAGHPELLEKVENAVRVHQANDISVSSALAVAKILERVVLGSNVPDAIAWAIKEGRDINWL